MKKLLFTIAGLSVVAVATAAVAETIPVDSTAELFAVRDRLRAQKPTAPLTVRLQAGTYFLDRPFALTAADSGTPDAPITYVGEKGKTFLTSAKRVPSERFVPWKDGIVVADIADLGVRFPTRQQIESVTIMPAPVPELFVDGERFATADWPNAGEWATFTNFVENGVGWDVKTPTNALGQAWSAGVFGYDGDRPARWTTAPYLWVHGYFKWDWRDNLVWIKAVDPEARTISLGGRATYGLGRGNPSPRRWRAIHVLAELDAPGEYYVDFFEKKLYLKPHRPLTAETCVEIVAGADTLVTFKDVKNVALRDLALVGANQALTGSGCRKVTLKNLFVTKIRGNAVSLENCAETRVETCDITAIGGRCLRLAGGDRKTLEPSGNCVIDCDLGPAGLVTKTGAAGFETTGVGTVFRHNFVHDMPHHAIGIGWVGANDCVFAENIISNCCNESDDASAFYKGRNPSACGNLIEGNVFVDCGRNGKHGTCAIYFDDGDCGDIVRGNVFERCGNPPRHPGASVWGAIFFNGGYAFTCEDNVFIDCYAGASTSAPEGWCTDAWWRGELDGRLGARLAEVNATGEVYTVKYPFLKTIYPPLPVTARTNFLSRCSFVNVLTPVNGRTHCRPDCRILKTDDGTRPAASRAAGLLTPRRGTVPAGQTALAPTVACPNPGSWTVETERKESANADLDEYVIRLSSPTSAVPPQVEVSFDVPQLDAHHKWTTQTERVTMPPNWSSSTTSRLCSSLPLVSFLNDNDRNRILVAASEAKRTVKIEAGLREEDCRIVFKLVFFTEPEAPVSDAEVRVRIDRRDTFFGTAIAEGVAWIEKTAKLTAVRQYGNMMRAGDCPGDLLANRARTANLRLTSGKTAVHADMLEWNVADTPENAARFVLSAMFSTIQYSVMLRTLPADHKRMVAHWLDFSRRHRHALLKGWFRPHHYEANYPWIEAGDDKETVIGCYQQGTVLPVPSDGKVVYVLDGTGTGELVLDLAAPMSVRLTDTFGTPSGEAKLARGLQRVRLPRSGYLVLEGTDGGCETWNEGWTFRRVGGQEESVDLPHDAAIGFAFDPTRFSTGCGALPYAGRVDYAKPLVVTPEACAALASGTTVWWLAFDGVMSHAKVFVNGVLKAERPNGYASFRVPLDNLVAGTNDVRVVVDAPPESSRWYPGLGIYRDVRLVRAPADHVIPGSVAIVTESVTPERACLRATWEMSVSGPQELRFDVPKPQLWSPETPKLYSIELGGETFRYGIRTLRFSPTEGFFLNGVHRQMRGVCLHHDLGVFGAAFVRDAARRQLALLKEMGCDAIRTSHNFPAPGLLDLCDEMGFLVMDEAFDEWKSPKVKHGMAEVWDDWHVREVVDFVRRDRNHPCVVMWSAGNELGEDEPKRDLCGQGVAIARELTALFHANDPEGRPVTAGHWQPSTVTNGIGAATDVFGANYLPSTYASFRGRQGVIGTETCSTVSTRGTFAFPVDDKLAVTNLVSDYGLCTMWPNDYPPDVEFAAQEANPHVYGEFVWTGFDYLGEPDPWRKTSRSSYFGIFDLCGFPKSRYWLYKSQWRPDVPLVHIVPHWNWKSGDHIPVHVFTSGDAVELFLNGRSLGVRRKERGVYRLVWDAVPWEPGELVAVATKGGRPWARDVRETTGPFARLAFSDENYGPYLFRTVRAVDAEGREVPTAAVSVTAEPPDGYRLVGTCNGDPADLQSLRSPTVKTFNGRALIVYRHEKTP